MDHVIKKIYLENLISLQKLQHITDTTHNYCKVI